MLIILFLLDLKTIIYNREFKNKLIFFVWDSTPRNLNLALKQKEYSTIQAYFLKYLFKFLIKTKKKRLRVQRQLLKVKLIIKPQDGVLTSNRLKNDAGVFD